MYNKYIKEFKTAVESVPKNQKEFHVVINTDKNPSGAYRGQFNSPTRNKVALVIMVQVFQRRDVMLHSRNSKLVCIREVHCAYDTLQYPLITWRGCLLHLPYSMQLGHQGPSQESSVNSRFLFFHTHGTRWGELLTATLNQFLVEIHAKIETERLNFI